MPKSAAPEIAPRGKKWCARHDNGDGAFLPDDQFPPNYSYCFACKREYQRKWDKEVRKRPPKIIEPNARLARNGRMLIVHLPNDEKGRNLVRDLMGRYPDGNSYIQK